MTLLFILIALSIDYFSGGLERFRNFNWFVTLHYWLERNLARYRLWNGSLGLLITLSIPIIALLTLVSLFDNGLWLAESLLTLIILIYCLTPKDLDNRLNSYIAEIDGDDTNASVTVAGELIDKKLVNESDNEEMAIIKSAIVEAHSRTFAILFWFLVLGIVGVFLYRLVQELNDELHDIHSSYSDSARILLTILEWPSSRLMIIGFALSGHWVDTLSNWRKTEGLFFAVNKAVLMEAGIGALQYLPDIDVPGRKRSYWIGELKSLLRRSLFVWLSVLGIMTLSGIAS